MAEAAVSFLLQKIDGVFRRELSLPENIKEGINRLKEELELKTATIKDADGQGDQGYENKVLIQRIRRIVDDIEYVVDVFEYQNAGNNLPWYSRSSRILENHSLAAIIKRTETKLKNIDEKKERYVQNVEFPDHASTASSDTAGIAPLYTPEVEIEGVEERREELASWVLDVEQAYRVMFVVGMGGSGKTALVKLLYEQLKTDFDCHLWLIASKSVASREILSTMFTKLCNQAAESPSISSRAFKRDLIDKLRHYLQDKRYLIVLDDLWTRKVWESVKYALPNDNRSRVIITTRRGDIASSCRENCVDVYNLQALPFEKAQQLFYRKAFRQSGMYPSPPELRLLCENLLKKCEGWPFGIIEIGNLLSGREKSVFELQKLNDSLQAELTSGQLSSITRVLLLSYNDLPYHLKCCFLYMSMFPESYPVKRTTLIRLWIAEGFIEGNHGKQLEDIGEEYLKELIERNLIQASEFDFDGRLRTCRLHNLMHKIALSKSEAENFVTVRTDRGGDNSEKTRRLSIQKGEFDLSNENLPRACTLFTSNFHLKTPPDVNSSFNLLKILHLDGAQVDTFPRGIKKLLLLKYLCLSNTRIKKIPMSIGRLRFLETLNLKQTFVTALPSTLANLKKLRHLLVSRYNIECYVAFDAVQGFKAPTEISKLTNLQKLSFVRADGNHKIIRVLGSLTELRKLGIIDLPSSSGPILCATIQRLRNLHSLSVASLHSEEVLKLQEINYPPPYLRRLHLKGRLEKMPHWISKLHDLVRIRLKWSKLTHEENPITILGELPNLLELQMLDAYMGSQLDINAGKFPALKILEFERMEQLEMIIIENGALPGLQTLIITKCEKLWQIPVGIDNIRQLKELYLGDLPPHFVDPLRRNGEKRHLVQHIKKICSKRLHQNGHQWEWEDLS